MKKLPTFENRLIANNLLISSYYMPFCGKHAKLDVKFYFPKIAHFVLEFLAVSLQGYF